MSGRIKALWLLGRAFIATVVGLVFGRRGQGWKRFRAQYDAERLIASSPGDLELLAGLGRCIACGLCDHGEAPRIAAARGVYPGVMPLVLNSVRTTGDLAAAAHAFACVPSEVLGEKQRICPTDVPLRALADFVAGKARELGGPLPVPATLPPPPSGRP